MSENPVCSKNGQPSGVTGAEHSMAGEGRRPKEGLALEGLSRGVT